MRRNQARPAEGAGCAAQSRNLRRKYSGQKDWERHKHKACLEDHIAQLIRSKGYLWELN